MTKTFSLLLLTLFSFSALAQDKFVARLEISGNVSELGISPSEEVWVATAAGNVYYTKKIGDLWHLGSLGTYNRYDGTTSGRHFERVNFLSEDTLMVSGFIQADHLQNFVFLSKNHGKVWEKVSFGESSWIDAAYVNTSGKIWMSGSSQFIYHSIDRGRTWTTLNKIEPTGNMRVSSIYISRDEKTGLFGTSWNAIYKTTDNCKTWQKIISPLSQRKYKPVSKSDRADVDKVRILENQYIVKQQGRVFVSNEKEINWRQLPDAVDFEVTEDNNLYVVERNLSVSLYDVNFTKIWQSAHNLQGWLKAIAVKNNKLFALTSRCLYKVSADGFESAELFTNDIDIPEPDNKIAIAGEDYGFEDRDILKFDKLNKKWFRLMTLNFPIFNPTIYQNKLIISDADAINKFYQVKLPETSIDDFTLPDVIFADKVITEIHFEAGSQGCFHSDNSIRSYKKNSGKFILDTRRSTTKYLTAANKEIDEVLIKSLLEAAEIPQYQQIQLSDLGISGDDKKRYKAFITDEEQRIKKSGIRLVDQLDNFYAFPGENIDFDNYKTLADSLEKIDVKEIGNAFWQSSGILSTTVDTRRVIFVFNDGKKLIIENFDNKPNYLYTPWLVNYDGLKFKTNSIKFGKQVDKITHGQFFIKETRDKKYALFKIADYLYRQQIKDGL